MFVVTVTFILKPGTAEQFMPQMRENAQLSLSVEPGCKRFDVCESPDCAEEIFLYELYTDPDAFEAHKTMPHYLEFSNKTDALVAEKTIKIYHLPAA